MSIVENIKSVASTIQQIDNIELYQKILEVQKEAIDLLNENRELKEERAELLNKIKIKDQLLFDDNLYWLVEDNGKRNGPFCSRCWDVDQKLVRMKNDSNEFYFSCPDIQRCQNGVKIKESKERSY